MQGVQWLNSGPQRSSRRAQRCQTVRCQAGSNTPRKPVKVHLKIPYRVQFGQCLGIVGAGDLLGNWDPNKAVRMNWTSGDLWVAELSVEPGTATQLEYKYVIVGGDGKVCQWKPGQNYRLDVLAARGTRLLVAETWDDGPRHVEVETSAEDQPAPAPAAPPQAQAQAPEPAPAQAAAPPPPPPPAPARSPSPARVPSPPPASKPPPAQSTSPSPGIAVIQREANLAMAELKLVLDQQVNTMQRVTDPTDLEVILGDRLLAAANNKAVALNRALKAAESMPALPGTIAPTSNNNS